ncbi:MAG: DMT family transporter, partial [Pseudomonadota bacterium]
MADRPSPAALFALVAAAMVAFAANSVLTRMALAPELMEGGRFASIRIASGALTLWLLLALRGGWRAPRPPNSLAMTAGLAAYMIGFSYAYERLDAGVGALILFGCVQLAMQGWGFWRGERLTPPGLCGLGLALIGMILILAPGAATAPDALGAGLMIAAGIGWAVYSLLGRTAGAPLPATAWNFLLCVPAVLFVDLALADGGAMPAEGIAIAVASGALASGLGYAIWYAALPHLTATRAA